MACKSFKTLEDKVHTQLYTNISLLTHLYTPTKEFVAVFQKDMFVKNNSAAFRQVVYYLLNVLDYEKLKEKVTNWPVCDSKMETQFRREIIKYLNELNSIYEDAGLTSVLMSHVITPGGLQFSKYMLKLSQLVLYEHLKRTQNGPDVMLDRIHPNKNTAITEITISKMRKLTKETNVEINEIKVNFGSKIKKYKNESERICEELRSSFEALPALKEKLIALQSNMEADPINSDGISKIQDEIIILKEKFKRFVTVKEKFSRIIELMIPLLKQDLFFSYKPEMYPCKITDSSEELNLIKSLEKLNHFLQNQSLDLDLITEKDLERNTEKFRNVNKRLEKHVRDLEKINENLSDLNLQLETMKNQRCISVPEIKVGLPETYSEETLAVPLESTEQSSLGLLSLGDLKD